MVSIDARNSDGGSWLTTLAAILLLLVAAPWLFVGLVGLGAAVIEIGRGCEPTVPICRSFGVYLLAVPIVCLPIGIVHLLAAIGTFQRSRMGTGLAWALAIIGAVATAYLFVSSLSPNYFADDGSGTRVPHYDMNSRLLGFTFLPYAGALVLLVADRRRRRE
jgi:hypothetical protein